MRVIYVKEGFLSVKDCQFLKGIVDKKSKQTDITGLLALMCVLKGNLKCVFVNA